MNNWIKKVVAVSFVVAQFLVTPAVSASSLENIQEEKNVVEQEISQLQSEVAVSLEEVSQITVGLEELRQEIETQKETIIETEQNIEAQEIVVQERYEYAADQLQAMQKNEINQNIIVSLLSAESFTDLLSKMVAVARLTGASEERIIEAQNEKEKLDTLQEELVAHKKTLDAKETETVQQKEQLDSKVANLRTNLTNNEKQLAELTAQEENIRAEMAAKEAAAKEMAAKAAAAKEMAAKEAAVKEAAAKAAAEQAATTKVATKEAKNVQVSTAAVKQPEKSNSNTTQTQSAPAPKQESSSAGSWMSVQATGYSTQQPGLSTHTATGIDLRVNPRVIAVDPSVIPLGSLVEVQGLGVYIAGDTGGAIKGRIIDIHYSSVSQALSWGRRNVNIRIIN